MKGKKKVKEPAGMNIPEIFAALAMLEKERGIPQTFMMDKIIQAVTTAYKRDHKDVENVIVDVDEEHQRLKMYVQKNVVAEEDYVDPFNEIPVEEAKTISAKYEIGDVVNIPVDNTEFGRIAAGNGKQVIIQGLREAERGMVYDEFNSKQHEILTGVVTRIDPRTNAVSLRIGTGTESTEALLLSGEQVPGEELVEGVGPKGQRVAAIVDELRGEKIDIIKWSEDPAQFIAAALAPSDVVDVMMAEEGKACRVIVPDDQLSLAIGKEGQNARLAARLTGYKIDIKPESYQGEDDEEIVDEEPVQ